MGVSWGLGRHRVLCNLLLSIYLSCFLVLSFLHPNLLCCNLHKQRVHCVSVQADARIKCGCLQNIWNMERGIRGSSKDVSARPGPQIYSVDVSAFTERRWKDSLVLFFSQTSSTLHCPSTPFLLPLSPILHVGALNGQQVWKRRFSSVVTDCEAERSSVFWCLWGRCVTCHTKPAHRQEIYLGTGSGLAQKKVSEYVPPCKLSTEEPS